MQGHRVIGKPDKVFDFENCCQNRHNIKQIRTEIIALQYLCDPDHSLHFRNIYLIIFITLRNNTPVPPLLTVFVCSALQVSATHQREAILQAKCSKN